MPRTRKVDKTVAQQKALSAFWKIGYNQLGVRALEEATGINRFALQKEYGGKAGLFIKVLDDYLLLSENGVFNNVSNGGLEEVATLFLMRADNETLPEETRYGCLAINTACENDGKNEEINHRIMNFFDMIGDAFKSALSNEKKQGTLKDNVNIQQACEFLRGELIGLNVVARANRDNQAILPAVKFTANIVRSWKK
ncbi:hypothetical protein A9Q99_15000 [Gammaproteobacteria bacterium 45_16_T64]|nr:hypothetical protein A9Q99_15000 [Gammaproteobacteria bacterium 45_16_T64]